MTHLTNRPTAVVAVAALALCAAGTSAFALSPANEAASTSAVTSAAADAQPVEIIKEEGFVETGTDTDHDGVGDRVHFEVQRPAGATNVPVVFMHSPYFDGVNDVPNHNVEVDRLPQDAAVPALRVGAETMSTRTAAADAPRTKDFLTAGYAVIWGRSIGHGKSTGCATIGDRAEALGGKAIIDWVGGRKPATNADGTQQVSRDWASGNVGMVGVSYNGTLPTMVATEDVPNLKAIIPIAAISNWYDYYRANGLVVAPGGFQGEDADVLGKFVSRPGCDKAWEQMFIDQDRTTGDFNEFWQARDYTAKLQNIKAATFIMHGQADWNVRPKHAINLWNELNKTAAPHRMWLGNGAHGYPDHPQLKAQTIGWMDRYVKGIANDIEAQPAVEVQDIKGAWSTQSKFPHQDSTRETFYLTHGFAGKPVGLLSPEPRARAIREFVDTGRDNDVPALAANATSPRNDRALFTSRPLDADTLLTGTTSVNVRLAVQNRQAANVTVALVEYKADGSHHVVTRGWMDPQNHADIRQGSLLTPGEFYTLKFDLEPQQYTFAAGSKIGVAVLSTDKDGTLLPLAGTELAVDTGMSSTVSMNLARR